MSPLPLIEPSDIRPSDQRLEVIAVLNPTFVEFGARRYLVVRVDERPKDFLRSYGGRTFIAIPWLNFADDCRIELLEVEVPGSYSPEADPILPQSVRQAAARQHERHVFLPYISHLRLADLAGVHPTVRDIPLVFPDSQFSQYGCEDPRATVLEGSPLVTYTAVGSFGATAWFATLRESATLRTATMILGPDHKHTALFPEKVGNYYYLLSRPLIRTDFRLWGAWLFRSPDLYHWGKAVPLLLPRPGMWDSVRVGPCTSPIPTPAGWLVFYYGVDSENSYHVGAAILDTHDPATVVARSTEPVLSPVLDWERIGRRADIVFVCGCETLPQQGAFRVYYGAADRCVGAADIPTRDLLRALSTRIT